jgi:hypothetical protein
MHVGTPHAATPELQGNTLQSLIVQSPSMSISNEDRADYDDNVINTAYDEIRRSVSPRVAEYIFQPRENRSSSTEHNFAEGGWTFQRILNVSITEHELRQLSHEILNTLTDLALNLWNFGQQKYMYYCTHIYELILARDQLVGPINQEDLDLKRWNLAMFYMNADRKPECEAILIYLIAEIDLLRPGHPLGDESRSLLGRLRSVQGQHTPAQQLCTQAMLSLRSASGLAHHKTWRAYGNLRCVLEAQGRFDDVRKLVTEFYSDVHRTVSAQVLPGLNSVLELCRSYIESWMAESKLQRLVRDGILQDIPLGIGEEFTLILGTLFRKRFREERNQAFREKLKSLRVIDLPILDLLSTASLLIASRIQAVQHLTSISLRQEALRAVQDLMSTKLLMPLWTFMFLHYNCFWTNNNYWKRFEYNIIHSLEDRVKDRVHPVEASSFSLSTDPDPSVSPLAIAESPTIRRSDLLNDSESSMVIPTAPGQASSPETFNSPFSLYIGTRMPSAVTSTSLLPPNRQSTSVSTEWRALAGLDYTNIVASPSVNSWNPDPSFPQTWALAQRHQTSDYPRLQNTVSPSTTFSQPPSSAQGHQSFDNAPAQNGFSPTMMNMPIPPFTFGLPQTRNPSYMTPPPRPGE